MFCFPHIHLANCCLFLTICLSHTSRGGSPASVPPRLEPPPAQLCALQFDRLTDLAGHPKTVGFLPPLSASSLIPFPWPASAHIPIVDVRVLNLPCWPSAVAVCLLLFFVFCIFFLLFESILMYCMKYVAFFSMSPYMCITLLSEPIKSPIIVCLTHARNGLTKLSWHPSTGSSDSWVLAMHFYYARNCFMLFLLLYVAYRPLGVRLYILTPLAPYGIPKNNDLECPGSR